MDLDYEKEYKELKEEFDKVFNKLYLATEENKQLVKENKKMEKRLNILIERVIDLSHQLGIEPRI